jgi:hypothetical protein
MVNGYDVNLAKDSAALKYPALIRVLQRYSHADGEALLLHIFYKVK